jgi:ADP-ribosyl-[dinitrogen reductase] hydrolase
MYSERVIDLNRATGALLGLAVGDAVGATNEFTMAPAPINDMVGGGPFDLAPGEWTDDTSMALCLADSLIAKRGFDGADQIARYIRWWKEGYNSVLGYCFDIGNTTRAALQRHLDTGVVYAGSNDPEASGNGSLMRLAPIPIFFANSVMATTGMAVASSIVTHAAKDCTDSCFQYALMIRRALLGKTKEEVFENIKVVAREDVVPSGYVVESMEAALYCFANTDNFRDGCLMAANLGGDSDTIAAIYGQLAGAFYGESGIPAEWLAKLSWCDDIRQKAIQLVEVGQTYEENKNSTV